jgi:hypothetical protein
LLKEPCVVLYTDKNCLRLSTRSQDDPFVSVGDASAKCTVSILYTEHFKLLEEISTRDRTGIQKTSPA